MISLNKRTVKNVIGKGIVYSFKNFHADENDNKIKWDNFKFYTPLGNLTNANGRRYFEVEAEEYVIERGTISKRFIIKVDKENGLEAIEWDIDSTREGIRMGLEGDIIVRGFIPSDPTQEITIVYMEVLS